MFSTTLLRIALATLGASLLGAGIVASNPGLSRGAGAAPAGTSTFTDPTADAQGGPDITRVVVTGDAATGRVMFTATAPGYIPPATPDTLEREVILWLDTDENAATGDPQDGTEYGLQAWNGPEGRFWTMVRWNGVDWDDVSLSPTMSFSRQGDVLSWTVSTTDLGGAARFRFYAFAGTFNPASQRYDTRDLAPDFGSWSYDIAAAPTQATPPPKSDVDLLIRQPSTTPKVPQAGKRFTVGFPVAFMKTATTLVIDLATGQSREVMNVSWTPATGGTLTCTASVGRKVPAHCAPFKGHVARVSLLVPKDAAGKVLRIMVKLTAKEKQTGKTVKASRVVTFRVK